MPCGMIPDDGKCIKLWLWEHQGFTRGNRSYQENPQGQTALGFIQGLWNDSEETQKLSKKENKAVVTRGQVFSFSTWVRMNKDTVDLEILQMEMAMDRWPFQNSWRVLYTVLKLYQANIQSVISWRLLWVTVSWVILVKPKKNYYLEDNNSHQILHHYLNISKYDQTDRECNPQQLLFGLSVKQLLLHMEVGLWMEWTSFSVKCYMP